MTTPTGPDSPEAQTSRDAVLAALRDLLPQLERVGVTELEVTSGESRVLLRRRPGHLAATMRINGDAETAGSATYESLLAITTPLSGVFFSSPAPDEPPYVREGDEVEAGQVVALVEAMKVFNEIHAEVPGTIVKIHAVAGQLVQSGQTLLHLRPSDVSVVPGGEGV